MEREADICILGEGSYPYFLGGVAQWVHELITEHKDRTFHVMSLLPLNPELNMAYKFPKNVIGHTYYSIQHLPKGSFPFRTPNRTWEILYKTFKSMVNSPEFEDFL